MHRRLRQLVLGTLLCCAAASTACLSSNTPPRLLAVNGVTYNQRFGFFAGDPKFKYTAGEDFLITVDAIDPDGHGLRMWWPNAPPGWEFDPDAAQGVWRVPVQRLGAPAGVLIIEDRHPTEPRSILVEVPFAEQRSSVDLDPGITDTGEPYDIGDTDEPDELWDTDAE